ncbi:MAG: ABC transporter substrate-binding protein [Oligoflexales bacterium]|nr:ABC transporter substrate-binding protein [Oligoflexales bacterium]
MKKLTKLFGIIFVLQLIEIPCQANAETKPYRIGILQMVDDLNNAVEGFKEGLKELGYVEGKDVKYDYMNARANPSKIIEYANYFLEIKKDLIFACSTPVTKILKSITKERKNNTPVVFTPVSDPVAAGIAESWNSSGNNLTGVASGVVTDVQLELMLKIKPSIKKVLVISKKGDNSSEEGLKKIITKAKELSIELVVKRPEKPSDVIADMEKIDLSTIDAIHIPPDTMVGNQIETIFGSSRKYKIPIIVHSPLMMKDGGFLYYVSDYFQLGRQAARQAHKILKEKIPPKNIPIEKPTEYYLGVNKNLLEEYQLKLPADLMTKAKLVSM